MVHRHDTIEFTDSNGQFTSADEASGALSSVFRPLYLLPSREGEFELQFRHVTLDGLTSLSESSSTGLTLIPKVPFDAYVMLLPSRGGIRVELSGGRQLQSPVASGLLFDARDVSRVYQSKGLDLCGLVISAADLHRALADALDRPVGERLEFSPHVPKSPPVLMLEALGRAMRGDDENAELLRMPLIAHSLKSSVLNVLIDLLPHNFSVRLRGRTLLPASRELGLAIDFMEENADKPIKGADIARAAGISLRSLQLGFRRADLGTPGAYLRRIRLKRVQAELATPRSDTRVTSSARRWGFANPGAFAALYQQTFGERPSVTLQHGRARLGLPGYLGSTRD